MSVGSENNMNSKEVAGLKEEKEGASGNRGFPA